MDIRKIAEKIGNKKIITAVDSGDKKMAELIARKLYTKARNVQDSKEHLLASVIIWSTSADEALINHEAILFANRKASESCLEDIDRLEMSAIYLKEKESIKKMLMKHLASDDEILSRKASSIINELS